MSDWKLDLETYGLQVEEEEEPSAVWTATRKLVMALWFQNGMTVLVFLYMIVTYIGMVLGKPATGR